MQDAPPPAPDPSTLVQLFSFVRNTPKTYLYRMENVFEVQAIALFIILEGQPNIGCQPISKHGIGLPADLILPSVSCNWLHMAA